MNAAQQDIPAAEPFAEAVPKQATWWVRLGAEHQGPMTLETLGQRWSAGVYSRLHEGSDNGKHWQPVSDILDAAEASSGSLMPDQDQESKGQSLSEVAKDFAWDALAGDAASSLVEATPISHPADASQAALRVALASGGALFLVLTLLPVIAHDGRAGAWWSWPGDHAGSAFAVMLAFWAGLGLAMCVLASLPRRSSEWTRRVGLSILVAAWLSGWLGLFGGPALVLVVPACLLAVPGLSAAFLKQGFFPKTSARVAAVSGLSVIAAAVVATSMSEILTVISGTGFFVMGMALLVLGAAVHLGTSFRIVTAAVSFAVAAGLLGTAIAGSHGAAAIRPDEPMQAGAQYVRSAILVAGSLALAGLVSSIGVPCFHRCSRARHAVIQGQGTRDAASPSEQIHRGNTS